MDTTLWQTTIGAFVGAVSAFAFNLAVERTRQKRDHKTAGHVALATLRAKLLYVQMVEQAWSDSRADEGPVWWQFRPASFPTDPRRIDLHALGFLAKSGKTAVITDVIDAEMNYFDLMAVVDAYRTYCVETLEPAMSLVKAPITLSGQAAFDLEKQLPEHVVGHVRDLHAQLDVRVAIVPRLVRDAAADLYSAMRTRFPGERFAEPYPTGRVADRTYGLPGRGEYERVDKLLTDSFS
jgi:hypothetical protein